MPYSLGTYGLGMAAGVLSTLSPCVLPLIPLVVGPALSAHPLGLLALSGGLALSFTVIGLVVATVGLAAGLDADFFRIVAAVLMVGFGLVLLSGRLQDRFGASAARFGDLGNGLMHKVTGHGVAGQFMIGLLLGAVWSPCVGPTLGAASLFASQGQHLADVALTMALFGIGASLPLLLIGWFGRVAVARWRGYLLTANRYGKSALGVVLIATGALVGSGLDKHLEAILVNASPAWLTDLTTRF
ncbi:MAG: cytochrome c biogenesis CcdA family protein [Hyphomicrobiaceae bacterium]